mmetsp:Transcript_32263/g.77030  ORF Transcript_32263/g.77030 Transcript_32263/m.77030 type:complete len:269 (-) Transcript_32263:1475-2281(-)
MPTPTASTTLCFTSLSASARPAFCAASCCPELTPAPSRVNPCPFRCAGIARFSRSPARTCFLSHWKAGALSSLAAAPVRVAAGACWASLATLARACCFFSASIALTSWLSLRCLRSTASESASTSRRSWAITFMSCLSQASSAPMDSSMLFLRWWRSSLCCSTVSTLCASRSSRCATSSSFSSTRIFRRTPGTFTAFSTCGVAFLKCVPDTESRYSSTWKLSGTSMSTFLGWNGAWSAPMRSAPPLGSWSTLVYTGAPPVGFLLRWWS